MKRSRGDSASESSRKVPRRDEEAFESLDKDALIEKILAIGDQLDEANEVTKTAKRRESFYRQQALERDKKIKNLTKERNDAYYSGVGQGPTQRDQLLDPFYYEAFTAMKEKITIKDKTIVEQQETIKKLEGGPDSELLYQLLKTKQQAFKKVRENEKNLRTIATLESNLALVHSLLYTIRKEKKESAQEIVERDMKIAELQRELSHLRSVVSGEDPEEEKPDVEDAPKEEEEEGKEEMEEVEEDDDVVILDDASGIDVDVSMLHRTSNSNSPDDVDEFDRAAAMNEERSVSVGENGTLKITV